MQDLSLGRKNPVMVAVITGPVFTNSVHSWVERRLTPIGESLQCRCITLGGPIGSLHSLLEKPPATLKGAKAFLDAKWEKLIEMLRSAIETTPDDLPLVIFSHFYGFDLWLHASLNLTRRARKDLLDWHRRNWVTKIQDLGVGLPFYFDLTCLTPEKNIECLMEHFKTLHEDAGASPIQASRVAEYIELRERLSRKIYFAPETGQERSQLTMRKGAVDELSTVGNQIIAILRGVTGQRFENKRPELADAAD